MADRRRRTRERSSTGSEELSDEDKEHSVGKESDGEHSEPGEKPAVESEYESAEEEEEGIGNGSDDKKSKKKEQHHHHHQDKSKTPETPELPREEEIVTVEVIETKRLEENEDSGAAETKEDKVLLIQEDFLEQEEIPEMHDFIDGETSGDLLDGGAEEAADIEVECEFNEDDDDLLEDGEEYFEGERQQGDGEESATPVPSKEKVLDDDEDRRNPQYIPKKGSFYEHDDRLGSEHEEEEEPKETKEKEKGKKKKLWLDEGRWGHDMYREEEQGPKSREELIAVYGYDIRNEDNAPRARRRRRYGRGPNKYTRNWQDEDAYFKARQQQAMTGGESVVPQRGRGRGTPPGSRHQQPRNDDNNNDGGGNENQESLLENTEEFPALPSMQQHKQQQPAQPINVERKESEELPGEEVVVKTLTFQNSQLSQREDNFVGGRGARYQQDRRPPRGRGRGRRGRNDFASRETQREESNTLLEDAMDRLAIDDHQQQSQLPPSSRPYRESKPPPRRDNGNSQKVSMEGPRGGSNAASRPKRYSSLRQRSLPDNPSGYPASQSPVTTQAYYDTGYHHRTAVYTACDSGGTAPSPAAAATQVSQPPPPPPPLMNPFQGFTQAPYHHQDTFAMRAPMANPPRAMFTPVTLAASAPPVTHFISQSPANLISYAPPPAPAVYPQFQHFQQFQPPLAPAPSPAAVVGPMGPIPSQEARPVAGQQAEIFHSGITYYNTHSQQHVMGRHLPQKRPKAAIPILPPPNSEEKDDMGNSSSSTVEVEVS